MLERQFDALVAAAGSEGVPAGSEEGIDFDGLVVTEADDGYRFETPAETATGLDREELREYARNSAFVTNWYFWEWEVQRHGRARRAFCRKLEAADDHSVPERYDALDDGLVTEWGQLRIEATLGADGFREYELRHADDQGVDASELTTHDDPLDAREIAKTDADGRYRPLKTAPTLSDGWLFDGLNWRDLTEAVETFYPATVANWYREQTDDLDVDHWRDTVQRQSGIYGVVKTWDRGEGHEHVNWVAESCCDDSQCVKRREWQYDDETDLDVDGGDGEFPCREPCSLVIAAARQWTKLEGEQTQTYEFELTPSEKEQIEEIVDAVADGRTPDIREADIYEGANRYRTRFLRAKLMDEEGRLGGVPTNPDGESDD